MTANDVTRYLRHPNRPAPLPRIPRARRAPVDDPVPLDCLTRAQLERLYAVACQSRPLFAMTYDLGVMLGYEEGYAA